MAKSTRSKSLPAAKNVTHGNKMIEVRVRFWTEKIDPTQRKGTNFPKHCWDHGIVVMDDNPDHGFKQKVPIPFNSILELTARLGKLLAREGVRIHPGNKLRKILY